MTHFSSRSFFSYEMISLHKSANSDMSILSGIELPEDDNLESQYALRVAFQTMKERCQHLQARLAAVEEENVRLRLECGKDGSASAVRSELNSEEDEVLVLRVCTLQCVSFYQFKGSLPTFLR